MEDPSTPTFPNISSSISQKSMMDTCTILSRVIKPKDDKDFILHFLWIFVQKILDQDKSLKLATEDEFLEKAKNYLDGDFISKVKDMADPAENPVTSLRWCNLFSDGTYSIFFCLQCSNHFSISRCVL